MTELTPAGLGTIIAEFWQDARNEWTRLATLQKRIEGKLLRTWMPDNADLEYKDLFRKSSSPWLMFARDSIAQGLLIDGYTDQKVWRQAWQASGMDGRQGDLNAEVVGLGYGFLASLPHTMSDRVVMRPMSALQTHAVFEDPWDELPKYVLHRVSGDLNRPKTLRWIFIDGEALYRFKGDARTPLEVERTTHGLEYCPVARIGNSLPMGGRPQSSIEPAVSVYQRIVDATFTLQMVQRYGAFPQKWMAGGEIATDEHGNPLIRSSVDGLLHASGATGETARFGSFQAASLDQVVGAVDAHIKHFSALVQVPPHYLLGAIVNMSAEGIAAAEAGYWRNINDRQYAIGEGYELALRIAADHLGLESAADDFGSEVNWADMSTRSLNQVADAVVKLATVDAPLEMLFALVPNWSKSDAIDAADEVRRRRRAIEPPAFQPTDPPA